jgi:hypothetical protein
VISVLHNSFYGVTLPDRPPQAADAADDEIISNAERLARERKATGSALNSAKAKLTEWEEKHDVEKIAYHKKRVEECQQAHDDKKKEAAEAGKKRDEIMKTTDHQRATGHSFGNNLAPQDPDKQLYKYNYKNATYKAFRNI